MITAESAESATLTSVVVAAGAAFLRRSFGGTILRVLRVFVVNM